MAFSSLNNQPAPSISTVVDHQPMHNDGQMTALTGPNEHESAAYVSVVDVAMKTETTDDTDEMLQEKVATAATAESQHEENGRKRCAEETVPDEDDQVKSPSPTMTDQNTTPSVEDSTASASTLPESDAKRLKTGFSTHIPTSNPPNKQWNVMFDRLKAYKAKFGDTLVPKRFPEDPKLGTWVETQRAQYKRLHREFDAASGTEAVQPNKRLDHERLAKLESIGFAWSAKHVRKNNQANKKKQGDNVNGSAAASSSKPPPTRKPASAAPKTDKGNRWSDSQWDEMFQRLVKYKETHGDCLVPRKFDQDPKLASWVENQRVLWNRDLRIAQATTAVAVAANDKNTDMDEAASLLLPDPPPYDVVAMEVENSISDWNTGEATPEDAAELVATLTESEVAVVAAAEAAAAEAVDAITAGTKPPPLKNKLTQERKDKLTALGFVWSLRTKRIEDHWDFMFQQLVDYKNKHGDCLVPSRYEENLKLGKWVETQRYEYTKLQRSSSPTTAALKEPPPGSEPAMAAPVAASASAADGTKPRATNPRLTEDRLRRLESIGFEWKVRNKMKRYYDKQWQDMFERLLKFKEENGHCVVPKRYPPDLRLGTWVHTQRVQRRKMMNNGNKKKAPDSAAMDGGGLDENAMAAVPKGEEMSFRLTEERRKRLEEVGFVWSARESEVKSEPQAQPRVSRNSYDDLWDGMFDRLVAFKEKHGHCLVPKRYKEDPKLGTWVDTQRVQYKKVKGKEKTQYDSDPNSSPKTEAETAQPVQDSGLAPGFSGPVKPQGGRLTEDRIKRLEGLGFVWSLRDDWMKHYEELKAYQQQFGNCNVPARYASNRRLGIWVSAQRQQYKILNQQKQPAETGAAAPAETTEASKKKRAASLTPERIDLLNQLGFAWTIRSRDSLGESWNTRLADLVKYKEEHGNCLVPSRYSPNPELGVWVGTQRTQYRLYQKAKAAGQLVSGASAMNEERIRQLEELGFVWALRGNEGMRKDAQLLQAAVQNVVDVVAASAPEAAPALQELVQAVAEVAPESTAAFQEVADAVEAAAPAVSANAPPLEEVVHAVAEVAPESMPAFSEVVHAMTAAAPEAAPAFQEVVEAVAAAAPEVAPAFQEVVEAVNEVAPETAPALQQAVRAAVEAAAPDAQPMEDVQQHVFAL